MRDLYNKIIDFIGIDRICHFAVFGLCVALPAFFGWWAMGISFVLMTVLAWLKEWRIDEAPDKWDFIAGLAGGIVTICVKLLTLL